jgi:hypothetical protein
MDHLSHPPSKTRSTKISSLCVDQFWQIVIAVTAVALSANTAQASSKIDWYTLRIDSERVGYARIEQTNEKRGQIYTEVTRIAVKQLRHTSWVESHVVLKRNGGKKPLFMSADYLLGADHTHWSGRLEQTSGSMHVITNRVQRPLTLDISEAVLIDELIPRLAQLSADHRSTTFQYLEPRTASLTEWRADLVDIPESTDAASLREILLTKRDASANAAYRIWLNASGTMQRRESRLLGVTVQWEICEQHCDVSVEQPYDLMSSRIVSSPNHIPTEAKAGPIRYILSRVDAQAPNLPSTNEQTVLVEGRHAVLTVCTACDKSEALSDADHQRYLAPNPWVQSDDPILRHFAQHRGGTKQESPAEVMLKLTRAVAQHMNDSIEDRAPTVDYLGYASAREAFQTRVGDCTEYAVLLAALARARNVPARVVSGLAYASRFSGKKDVFSPHAWVQAWVNNHWVSYDPGLGAFDATHIALAIGDGRPGNFAPMPESTGVWHIEKIGLIQSPLPTK